MRIAYLILSQNHPENTFALIERIQGINSHCFVHIDAKRSHDFSDLVDIEGVSIIQSESKVKEGGFSMVKAILNLLQNAVSQEKFDYYILLSGNDYPIRSQKFIEFYLDKNYRRNEYMHIIKMSEEQSDMISRFHYDHNRQNPQNLLDFIYKGSEKLLKVFGFRKKLNFYPYTGSPWWALTHACITYILEFVARNPDFERIYKSAAYPSASFFHTIVAHSHFTRQVKHSLTYSDLNENAPEAPALIEEKHLDLFFENLYVESSRGRYLPLFVQQFNRYNAYLQEVIDDEIADFDHELALYEVYHSELLMRE